ncbi:MAG: hypothetical protein RLZZ303_182 [Candidatus Hydrogenedentota bacterium]|jgi:predicted RNase H-like HicB family nuclease
MSTTRRLTAIIEREDDWYVALCPELDVTSQGKTVEEARAMLTEAVELFLECASENEIRERLHGEVYVGSIEVTIG